MLELWLMRPWQPCGELEHIPGQYVIRSISPAHAPAPAPTTTPAPILAPAPTPKPTSTLEPTPAATICIHTHTHACNCNCISTQTQNCTRRCTRTHRPTHKDIHASALGICTSRLHSHIWSYERVDDDYKKHKCEKLTRREPTTGNMLACLFLITVHAYAHVGNQT